MPSIPTLHKTHTNQPNNKPKSAFQIKPRRLIVKPLCATVSNNNNEKGLNLAAQVLEKCRKQLLHNYSLQVLIYYQPLIIYLYLENSQM